MFRTARSSSALLALGTASALLFSGMSMVPAQAVQGTSDFSTSFEDSEQAKPAVSSPEIGKDGKPISSGVSGAANTDIVLKDSVLGSVTKVTASGENPPNEVAARLTDGAANTKWLVFANTGWAQYQLDGAKTVKSYSLTSGDDAPLRDPVDWQVQGSNDGSAWTTVDSQQGQSFADRGAKNVYAIKDPASFSYYRLNVTKTGNSGLLQLADWDIATGELPKPDPNTGKTMATVVGNGPANGYNVKSNAGFTGVRALKFSGTKTQAGRAFATNKLFDVNIPVGADTRLSYKIIPGADYVNYLSSYTAIDLHFTDGSYLSELPAVDQNGVTLTAQGQGDGKILYSAQWNYVLSEIGKVATGKTIDRILLGFDNTAAPADSVFNGWIDDLKIEGTPARIDASSKTNFVDTRRGTNSSGSFSRGNNLPITAVPNGFNFLAPVTNASSSTWEYDYQSANNAGNQPTLQGLGVSHIPSPWMGDRNQFSVMPAATTTPSNSKSARALAFSHDQETAQPDYYQVQLAGGINAEMTASDHGAVMRFSFNGSQNSLVFDSPKGGAKFAFDGSSVTGTVPAQGGSGQGDMFVFGSFDSAPSSTTASSPTAAAFASKTVTLRFATSFISQDQAKKNFDLEVSGQSFEDVRAAAKQQWNDRLGVVDVEGANDSQLTTLYSNLYRLNLYPNSGFENTGSAQTPKYQYRSPVSQDPATNLGKIVDGKIYVNNGFWDTYRTAWPAYSLLYPEKAAELVDGFVQQYRDGGWISRWSSPGYADLMTGTSSDVSFADAYLKGVPVPDPLSAYDAAVRNATVPSIGNSAVGRKGLTTSVFTGYTSSATGESVSWGLEGFINDFGLGNMAAKLAVDPATPEARRAQLKEDSAYYLNRAQYYVNMFDTEQGFFNGRSPGGEFQAGLDPESWGGLFTETDGWNFAFHAPQDGQGLAALYGGPAGLEKKLDAFFATPETADKPGGYGGVIHEMVEARAVRMGQLGMSNQPSHHIPYIYNYADAPAKTQATVREIQRRLYVGSEIGQGYSGDEDNGEMSSWNIFSSLGFYPLQVGSPHFSIGSPQFTKATIHWGNGKDLVINAKNNSTSNVYVQSLSVNGKAHPSTTLDQSEIANGGTMDFVMGPNPSNWGTGTIAAANAPEPIMDTTKDANLSSSGGENLKNLTDDNSASQVSFSVPTPVITLEYPAAKQKASFYTLTSGSTAPGADPTAWTLEGSNDGKAWTPLDTRKDISFDWRLQTKPFQIATPTPYAQYRLSISATKAGSKPVLAELELLAKAGDAVPGDLALTAVNGVTLAPGVDSQLVLGTVGGGKVANGYTATVSWGDGSAVTPATVGATGVVRPISATHNYAKPGVYQITVTATDGETKQSATLLATVGATNSAGLASAFDKVCLGDDPTVPNPAAANCDSVGYSFSRQALATAGVVQGTESSVLIGGKNLKFTLPEVPAGAPDNAMGSGQNIKLTLSKEATVLSFIGTGTQGNQDTAGTVTFTDGSSAPLPMQFSDWTLGANPNAVPAFGNAVVAKSPYRLAGSNKDSAIPFLFATAPYQIPPGKTVASVTLPKQAGAERDGRIHIFAIATDGSIVPPPALQISPAAGLQAEAGSSLEAALGTVAGGAPGLVAGQPVPADYSARIYWGDGTMTEDAALTVPGADGAAAITAKHVYAAAGSFVASLTVSDANGTKTVQIPVTVKAAPKPQPELAISPTTAVHPGDSVTVTGRKFDAGETVSLDFGSSDSATVHQSANADASGNVTFQLTVPKDAKAGPYSIILLGSVSKLPVSGTVLVEAVKPPVTYSPNARLDQTSAGHGETVRFSGDSFAPDELVSVSLHSDPLLLVTVQADAHGILTGEFTIPQAAALGGHQVVLTGAVSNKPVSIAFTVADRPVGPNPGDPGLGAGTVLPGGQPAAPSGEGLSGTGFDGAPLAMAGFAVLLAGAVIVFGVRRRRLLGR